MPMRRATASLTVGFIVAVAVTAAAPGARDRASGTLAIDTTVSSTRTPAGADDCPPGVPSRAVCAKYTGEGAIRGLGRVTTRYTKIITSMLGSGCEVSVARPLVIEVEAKGTIELASDACWFFRLPIDIGPFQFTVTGGSGTYGGATGSLTFSSRVAATPPGSRDTWTGTLSVPGYEFDLTPPTLTGARNRIVRVAKKAKRVRVRYSARANDAVDGSVPVTCEPRSGRFFKVGRTKVTCTAEDSSLNSATKSFTVSVKRRRR
jgi:hypothetical protein